MKIYLLELLKDDKCYDEDQAYLIASETKSDAVMMVKEASRNSWNNDGMQIEWDRADCTELGIYTGDKTEPFIIYTDYNAG